MGGWVETGMADVPGRESHEHRLGGEDPRLIERRKGTEQHHGIAKG